MKHRVWKLVAAAVLTLAITAGEFAGTAFAAPKDEKWTDIAAAIAKRTRTEQVKTIQWTAKTKRKLKGTVVRNKLNPKDPNIGQKVKLAKGTKVTIIQRDYHEQAGVSQCMLENGEQIYIANQYLNILKPICTGRQGDYSRETKLAFVNGQNITSKTGYMIWVSLDKQRVNVFTGSSGRWTLQKTWKTSTGKADAPTLDQSFKSVYRIQKKSKEVNGLYWYSFVYGSGIHRFPGSGASKVLGIQPVSHSCIRLKNKYAKWIFDTVPVKSRVFIW